MHTSEPIHRPFKILATLVLLSAVLGAAPLSASAGTCESWGARPPNVGTGDNVLVGVVVTSRCGAWAVGYYSSYDTLQTLVDRWNGTAWRHVGSPNVGSNSELTGVAATSSTNAWAVGLSWGEPLQEQTLILHWDGTSWQRVGSPNPGGASNSNALSGVAATSSFNAWAVGHYYNGTADRTLILHWDGVSWKRVASPNAEGPSNVLTGVAATSSTNAWAVGHYFNGTANQTLIVHWDGVSWKRVGSPNPGGSSHLNDLSAVAATSSSNAWAVGRYHSGTNEQTLILHWNGAAWMRQLSPNPGGSSNLNELSGVAGTSSTNAWAVGDYYNGTTFRTLIVHWNGTAWKRQMSPNVGNFANSLFAVSASSPSNAWAVGDYYNGSVNQTLAVHCC
jgi:hypothetical protein